METLQIKRVRIAKKAVPTVKKANKLKWLWLIFYPVGIYRVWRSKRRIGLKLIYTVLGLPLFLLLFGYAALLIFASFLPSLDRSVGRRQDRTVVNSEGNYSTTFVKTSAETNGDYELVKVELEPYGGNGWHYHSRFEESFTVLEGEASIGQDGDRELLLKKGESATASKKERHHFTNALNEKSVLLVKIAPAGGLEKSIRVAYGLINDGLLKNDMTKNPWHMALLLGYSETYLPEIPSWFQEPLVNALAKIAQWKGEDKELYKYFK
ncbi:MAG TPA: cupin domain-containing protein [Chryseolinea sp.]|nr:cupin domain-containing protein [Chryseolinea sp.]